ncbi:MAG: efflux RND transporter periplasmic adaptor subunit, partial [Comamonas sp.]
GVHVLTPGQKVTVYRDKYAKPAQNSQPNQPQAQAGVAQAAPETEATTQPAVAVEAGK